MSPHPLLRAEALAKHYPLPLPLAARMIGRTPRVVRAVDGVDLAILRGETLGLIGESGCGKSTLGRLLLRLHAPSAGRVMFDGTDITALDQRAMRPLRRRLQIIFQDPYASLNPRRTVEEILALPLTLHDGLSRTQARPRIVEMLDRVGLARAHLGRYPHQFSGGQRQRIGIARALMLRPELVVCDEPVSALDVSVQAQVLELLRDLRSAFGLAYLFISHDLAVVAHLASRIAVMYLGRIVEEGARAQVLQTPAHPYTQALIAAVPRRGHAPLDASFSPGELPSPIDPPAGCHFHPRCPSAGPRCRREAPLLVETAPTHRAACHLHAGGVQ